MKKVSILLLLTVVVASFTFAIEGVGDFTAGLEIDLDNITGGNGEALSVNPFEITIEYARSFGAFGLSAKLGNDLRIPTDKVKNGTDKIGDDLFFKVTPSYSLAAGPGELGFALGVQLNVPFTSEGYGLSVSYGLPYENIFFRIDPAISYGLDAGFGALAFELGTDHIQISKTVADNTEFKYGLEDIMLYFQAGVDLSFGLGLWVKPVFAIDATDDSRDADLFNNFVFDIHYAITEAITAGVEADIPTVEDGIKNGGITVTPYGDFSFGPIGAYVKIELSKLATDTNPSKDIQIKPIIGGSYSF